jgi:hypothetical protein
VTVGKESGKSNQADAKKEEEQMIPYEYGFNPEEMQNVELQIDLMKQLGRNCKALIKKAGRKLRKR